MRLKDLWTFLIGLGLFYLGACPLPSEICTDGADNDQNGQIDCDDSACTQEPICDLCGNGQLNIGEQCDGQALGGQSCGSLGFDTGALVCNDDCTLDASGCRDFVCGDGLQEGEEVCDDGNNQDGDGCTADCSRLELCGDGIVDIGEACDDGNQLDGDGCDGNCTVTACQNGVFADPQACFGTALNFSTGTNPFSVAAGDFNGDAVPDLVTANFGDNTISILLGNGDGSFQAPQNRTAGNQPRSVVIEDFNNDTFLDIAVANSGSNNLNLLLGNGDGTFQSPRLLNAGGQPSFLAAADFNGDSFLDLAVANFETNDVSVLLGSGNGFFQASTNLQVGSGNPLTGPSFVAAADFNEDNLPDILVANLNRNSAVLFLGNGDGTFQNPSFVFIGNDIFSLAIGDFTEDGFLDFIAVNFNTNSLSLNILNVRGGNGDGTFQELPFLFLEEEGMFSAVTNDFNGDGSLDLAITHSPSNKVSILLGNGDATFQEPATLFAGNGPRMALTEDLNNDGIPDLVTPNFDSNNISVFLNLP